MILRSVMSVKLHGLKVTQCHLHYSGSITIPRSICREAGLKEGDQVDVYNFENGARYSTYVIEGDGNEVAVNGPSARLCQPGDRIVVVQYVWTDEELKPKVLFFDENNRIVPPEQVFDNTKN